MLGNVLDQITKEASLFQWVACRAIIVCILEEPERHKRVSAAWNSK
jgi:hypothetical protein